MEAGESVYQDEIRVNGIQYKGYGQIAKIVMLDPSLTLEAKAVYSYFCSYCGGGNTAFPGRDKIISDLRVSKNTYYKHFRLLTDSGYISVEQKAGNASHSGFYKNIYTIEAFPSRYRSEIDTNGNEVLEASLKKVIREENITAAGYGIIPKSVMQADLSIQAKGIYAYLCSFSGQDYTASPSREVMLYHLNISHNTATKYVSELVTSSLVTTYRIKENGKIVGFKYCLNQNIGCKAALSAIGGHSSKITENNNGQSVSQPRFCDTPAYGPEPKIRDTDNEPEFPHDSPEPKICDTQKAELCPTISDTRFSDPQICDDNNTSSDITKSNTNHDTLNLSFPLTHEGEKNKNDYYGAYRDRVTEALNQSLTLPYSFLADRHLLGTAVRLLTDWDCRTEEGFYLGANAGLMEKMYLLFVDTLTEMLTIGKTTVIRGSQISYSMVYEQLTQNYLVVQNEDYWTGDLRISLGELPDDVIEAFLEANQTTRIKNPKSYMAAIIWTVLQQNGLRYILDAERDLG